MYSNGHSGDTRYRNKLKTRILEEFPNKFHFLTVDGKTPQVIISKEGIGERTILQDKIILIKQTASLLLEDITDYMNSLKDMPWPPTIESLTSNCQKMPQSFQLFMDKLLTSPGHDSEIVKCLSLSYTRDLIHGVTRGKVITLKHFLVGMGLHNITGQKLPIHMLSRLGHSVD